MRCLLVWTFCLDQLIFILYASAHPIVRIIVFMFKDLRKRFEIDDVADVVRKSRLEFFGHLERKDAGD